MKVVVTGAAGFLGRALLGCLEQRGVNVCGVSRRQFPGIVNVETYEDTPSGDVLVHLAEASDRMYAQVHAPSYALKASSLLRRLQRKGFSKIVYPSSAILYGDQAQFPCQVGDEVYGADAYSSLKLVSENLILEKESGVVARLTNIYGPGMSEANVFSAILRQISGTGPVRVFDASPVRDFLWVEDAARALADMVLSEHHGIFNVGSGVGLSIQELARNILVLAGQSERCIESVSSHPGYSKLVVNISHTTAAFGWQPEVTLKKGIVRLLRKCTAEE